MTLLRFLQLIILASVLVKGSALAHRQASTTFSVSEQALFGGYAYGESALLGGTCSYNLSRVNQPDGRSSPSNQKQAQSTFVSKQTHSSFVGELSRPGTFLPRK